MSKLQYNEASAYNDKIQGHVEAINKLIKFISVEGVQVIVVIKDDTHIISDHKVPIISVEASIKLQ